MKKTKGSGDIELHDFFLDNIQKIILPEEVIKLELSISRYELAALMLVKKHREPTMSSLAQGMAVPVSTATGIVDRLVRKGYLKRGSSEEDRRIVTVALTDKGTELVKQVQKLFRDFMKRIKSLLTGEEFETALQIVRKVAVGLQKAAPEPGGKNTQQRRSIKVE